MENNISYIEQNSINCPDKKQFNLDLVYLRMAREWSYNSHCKRSQVGCLVVKDKTIISDGYNGTPTGFPNICENENNETLQYVLHAEANAITKLAKNTVSSQGSTMYVTLSPCYDCSKLISQAPKATYVRNSVLRADDDNDFKILSLKPFKNQNTINALRSGVYASKNIFFNPYNYEYSEKIVKLSDQKLETYLGKQVDIPVDLDDFTRIHYHILDVGSMDSEVSINVNNDPREWQARSSMRYNLLFTQGLNIVVPCNPQLKAGDVVNCFFEKVTVENKNLGAFDEHQSGKYLIAHLCHSFDPKRSFTSLTLVRDTYGLYKK